MTDEQKKAFAEKMAAARAKAKAEKTGEAPVVAETVSEVPVTEVPAIDTAQEETSDPVEAVEEAAEVKAEAEIQGEESGVEGAVPVTPTEQPAEAAVPSSTEAVEETPAPVVDDGSVLLRSADGRALQASIGESVWQGVEIRVPAHQAADVRSLLEKGGFFLKD